MRSLTATQRVARPFSARSHARRTRRVRTTSFVRANGTIDAQNTSTLSPRAALAATPFAVPARLRMRRSMPPASRTSSTKARGPDPRQAPRARRASASIRRPPRTAAGGSRGGGDGPRRDRRMAHERAAQADHRLVPRFALERATSGRVDEAQRAVPGDRRERQTAGSAVTSTRLPRAARRAAGVSDRARRRRGRTVRGRRPRRPPTPAPSAAGRGARPWRCRRRSGAGGRSAVSSAGRGRGRTPPR